MLGPIILKSLVVNIGEKPWSQSWPMEIILRFPKAGKTLDCRAPIGIWGKGRRVVWDAWVYDPLGRPTRMPLDVEDLFVHVVVGPRKWMVQPESTMARVFGNKVRGDVFFATFPFF